LFVTAAYGNYLPKRFLAMGKFGTINIHPSLLPKYRGASPVQRCLENGDPITGVTLLYSVAKMDAGPILSQVIYPMKGNENAQTVLSDCFRIGTNALLQAMPKLFAGELKSIEQNHDKATHAPKIETSEGSLDFRLLTAKQVLNKSRAFSEWPGVFGFFKISHQDETETVHRIRLLKVVVLPESNEVSVPNLVTVSKEGGKEDMLVIRCKDDTRLGILEVHPAGRKAMTAKAFVNGVRGQLSWISPPEEITVATTNAVQQ
jgi:methionyl-tRNA formyltransferase